MFSERERERYKRQMLLFGDEGQERLKKAHIFIAGAGGLGSPVSLYLAVAGVGTITIVDTDVVDRTNLNRQILHFDRDIGRKKTESAQEKLQEINPDITIHAIDVKIDETNAADLVGKLMELWMPWTTILPVTCSTRSQLQRRSRSSMEVSGDSTGRQPPSFPEQPRA